jgi:hypothetical protein
MYRDIVVGGLWYNSVEVALIFIIGGVHLFGGEVWAPVLWLAVAAAAIWTLLASTNDAEEEAHELVMYREVLWTDFVMGAVFLIVIAGMVLQYSVWFGTIFLLAAVQNLRYSALAWDWIETNDRDNST